MRRAGAGRFKKEGLDGLDGRTGRTGRTNGRDGQNAIISIKDIYINPIVDIIQSPMDNTAILQIHKSDSRHNSESARPSARSPDRKQGGYGGGAAPRNRQL